MRLHTKTWDSVRPHTQKVYAPSTSQTGFTQTLQPGVQSALGKEPVDKFRAMRAAIPWLAAGIDIRSEGVIFAESTIGTKDPAVKLDEASTQLVQFIEAFFDSPDPGGISTNRARLLGPWVQDALVVGYGGIRKYLDDEGYITRLRTLDARRLKKNPKYDPDDPEKQTALEDGVPVMPRFYYMDMDKQTGRISRDHGEPLFADEVCLLEPTPTSYDETGLSPLLYLENYIDAHQDVFQAIWTVQKEGQPPGVFKIPSAQPATIAKLQSEWKKRARGKNGAIFVSIPADASWEPLGDTNLSARGAFTFMDIVVRGVAAALRISTVAIGWTQTTLERSATAQGESQDEGQFNLLRLAQGAINTDLLPFFKGTEDLFWRYTALPSDDEAENAETVAQWSGGHFVIPSPDDLRKRAGFDPIERKEGTLLDKAYQDMWVVTGTGPVPMFLYFGLAATQMVPGYDTETGEVDTDAALAQKVEQQQALAPPQLQLPDKGSGQGNGQTDGQTVDQSKVEVKKSAATDKIAREYEDALMKEYPWHERVS